MTSYFLNTLKMINQTIDCDILLQMASRMGWKCIC